MANQRMSPVGAFIFSVIFIVSGWMAYKHLTLPLAQEAAASEKWPMVTGEISYSDIKTSRSDNTTMYAADVQYTYQVNEKAYKGEKISMLEGSSSSQSMAKKTLKKYPRGKVVEVYYDPELPSIAILEPGQNIWIKLIKYAPLLFCLVGALIIIKGLLKLIKAVVFGR